MALFTWEGFDHMTSAPANDLAVRSGWSISGAAVSQKVAGLIAGSAMRLSNGGALAVRYDTGSSNTTMIVGFKFRAATISAATQTICRFLDSAAGIQVGLALLSSGLLILWKGTTATVLATSTRVFLAGGWYNIEIKITFSDTGSYTLNIDGAQEFTGSADTSQTANQNGRHFEMLSGNGQASVDFDDFYIGDATGSAPHNDFLGVVRVETLFPTSANATQWTPNASTNVSRVQEAANDGDTTYNSTSTSGHVDTFNHGALSSTPAVIFGVAVHATIRKDDVTARSARTKMISGATTQNGATTVVDTTYKWFVDQYIVDPNTAAAWTAANVNATKIGYEHI